MAFSSIAISNMALDHLGRSTASIESFAEKSVEARLCSRWYDISRQEILEAHDWSFGRKRQPLALHAEAPPDQWAYRYQKPSDCLAFRRIWNVYGEDVDAVPYELEVSSSGEDETILTNMDTAIGIYTRDVTQTPLFSALFINALSHHMASKMAFPLTGKLNVEAKEAQAVASALRLASASNANQGMQAPPRDAEWIRNR